MGAPPLSPIARTREEVSSAGAGKGKGEGRKRLVGSGNGSSSAAPDARDGWDSRPVKVRMLLAQSGLTQELAAARLGVAVRTLRRWLVDGDGPKIGYGDFCNLERLVAFRRRSTSAAQGRKRKRERARVDRG